MGHIAMTRALEFFQHLNHWQIDAVAITLLLQGVVIAIVPEELVILALGYLWRHEQVQFLEAVIAIQLGLLPANFFMVYAASRLGTRIFSIRPFCWFLSQERVERWAQRVRGHSSRIAFVTRFTPTIRGPVYVALGLANMKPMSFLRIDALASCLQVPALLFVGSRL